MQSNYKEGFNVEAIQIIINLIKTGNYSYSELVLDVKKLISGKLSEIENTIFLLTESKIIQEIDLKLRAIKNFNEKQIKNLLIKKLEKDNVFENLVYCIIKKDNFDYVDVRLLYSQGYSGLLSVLIHLDLIKVEADGYKLNNSFDAIKKVIAKTPEQLQKELDDQVQRGNEAEELVLSNELNRLKTHKKINDIKRVSTENVMLGYDIESFQSTKSEEIDKFIEVKSYVGSERFFWSINEIKSAQNKGDSYFLVIVDSENKKNNIFREIQNPFKFFDMKNILKKSAYDNYEIQPYNFLISL